MERQGAKIAVSGVAVLYIVSAISAATFALMLWGGSALFNFFEPSFLRSLGSGIAVGAAIFFAVLAVIDLVIGIGLFKEQEWARKAALVLAAFNLFSFPFGTITSLITIALLGLHDDIKKLFH